MLIYSWKEPHRKLWKTIYLGSIQSNVVGIEKDVKSRIGKTCSFFRQLQTVWGSKEISLTVKVKLYN